jgi:nitroreductase
MLWHSFKTGAAETSGQSLIGSHSKGHTLMPDSLSALIDTRFATASGIGRDRPASGTHALQLGHRSFRKFKPTPVADDTLDLLLACAFSAPSKSDLQQASVIKIDDPEIRDFIHTALPSMPWIATSPVFLLFCGDSRRIRRICAQRGTPFAHDPLDALFNATTDTAMVLQNFIIAAEAEGLGCCPISAVREITDSLAAMTNLPDGVFPLAGLCVGHADADPAISVRLPLAATVHKNRYDDSNLADIIDDYDRRRRQKNPYKSQRKIDEYGEDPAYGWSTDKARQTSSTDRLAFTAHVRSHGFDL